MGRLAGPVFLTGSELKQATRLLAGTHVLIQSGGRGSRKDTVTLRTNGTGTHEIWCEPHPNPSGTSAKEEWAGNWTVMSDGSDKVVVFNHCRQLDMPNGVSPRSDDENETLALIGSCPA